MKEIKAVGFDLFNTLIMVRETALDEALQRLVETLEGNGIPLEHDVFHEGHRRAALKFITDAKRDGRETHNSLWISAALGEQGYHLPPDDPRIAEAVDSYFSAFLDFSILVPGACEMLETLGKSYRLGLLSNFTHAPAARKIVKNLGLGTFFDVILISGELGYRKPHPAVFARLSEELGLNPQEIAYVGDDPQPDIDGALRSGLQPIWTTYVRDHKIAFAPGVEPREVENVTAKVPRISSWEELVSLLETQKPPPPV